MKARALLLTLPLIFSSVAMADEAADTEAAKNLRAYQYIAMAGAFAKECNASEGAEQAAYTNNLNQAKAATVESITTAQPSVTPKQANEELQRLNDAVNQKAKEVIAEESCDGEMAKNMISSYHQLAQQDFSDL
jgi:hypothetical protein